ncbi:MAG: segregation/condensation protein A [Clostridia bacterium]|nr:segregation/condensation protein A [Clostridia bacterium]
MGYKVKLNTFEGPFDLLVYLIENAKMNIYDIQVSEITSQYLAYMDKMQEMNVNLSTEFIVLAAELIEIKSKMLLPRTNPDDIYAVEEDPRSDLVERLLEYKRFKKGAAILEDQAEITSNIFEKPQEDISQYLENPDELINLDIKQFANAFNLFIRKKQRIEEVRKRYTRIERQRETAEARMKHIKSSFKRLGKKTVLFKELVPKKDDRYDVVLTFASLLELIKERDVVASQKRNFADIEVSEGEGK